MLHIFETFHTLGAKFNTFDHFLRFYTTILTFIYLFIFLQSFSQVNKKKLLLEIKL